MEIVRKVRILEMKEVKEMRETEMQETKKSEIQGVRATENSETQNEYEMKKAEDPKIKTTTNPEMEKPKKKTLQELDLSDDFLFAKVMEDEEICRLVLQKILDVKIKEVKRLESQLKNHHEA